MAAPKTRKEVKARAKKTITKLVKGHVKANLGSRGVGNYTRQTIANTPGHPQRRQAREQMGVQKAGAKRRKKK